MILLLGATGYVGRAFQSALHDRGEKYGTLSRSQLDYTDYATLVDFLRSTRPSLLINAAGYTGKPNVDACELAKAETLQGNVIFPLTVSHACDVTGTPWGHVSSGCIYSGAIVRESGVQRVEPDLSTSQMQQLVREHPEDITGFAESDEPNFSFRKPPCSFYSGSKALCEETLAADEKVYLWRLRIPFDNVDSSRNFFSKLQRYPKVYDNTNSVSHLGDFVHACLDLWRARAPFGIYNVTNPGFVTSRQIVELIRRTLAPSRSFEFWESDAEFYHSAAHAPRSNCILATSKLLNCGVSMRCVNEAIEDTLKNWQVER